MRAPRLLRLVVVNPQIFVTCLGSVFNNIISHIAMNVHFTQGTGNVFAQFIAQIAHQRFLHRLLPTKQPFIRWQLILGGQQRAPASLIPRSLRLNGALFGSGDVQLALVVPNSWLGRGRS